MSYKNFDYSPPSLQQRLWVELIVTYACFILQYGVKIFVMTSFKETCCIEILPNFQKKKQGKFLTLIFILTRVSLKFSGSFYMVMPLFMTHYSFFCWFIWKMAIFTLFLSSCSFSLSPAYVLSFSPPLSICFFPFLRIHALFSSSFWSHLPYPVYCDTIISCEYTKNNPFLQQGAVSNISFIDLLLLLSTIFKFSINQ